jgi:hypothetical protein
VSEIEIPDEAYGAAGGAAGEALLKLKGRFPWPDWFAGLMVPGCPRCVKRAYKRALRRGEGSETDR